MPVGGNLSGNSCSLTWTDRHPFFKGLQITAVYSECQHVAISMNETLSISITQGDSTQLAAGWLYSSNIPIKQEDC